MDFFFGFICGACIGAIVGILCAGLCSPPDKKGIMTMQTFDLTKHIADQSHALKIWGYAMIKIPAPANTNGLWRK